MGCKGVPPWTLSRGYSNVKPCFVYPTVAGGDGNLPGTAIIRLAAWNPNHCMGNGRAERA